MEELGRIPRYRLCRAILRNYLDYNEAKDYARKLKLKSNTEWAAYAKTDAKPINKLAAPQGRYKNKGWIDWKE